MDHYGTAKKRTKLQRLLFSALISTAFGLPTARGLGISDDFSSGSVTKDDAVRFREANIDLGWYANPDWQAPTYPESAWTISGGTLNNASDANNSEGEGAVVQVVTLTFQRGRYLSLSFDYTHATANDTLYVHLWGYDGTFIDDDPGEYIGNFQPIDGGYADNTDTPNDDGVDAYNLKDGTLHPGAGPAEALVALTGSGTYSTYIDIANLGISGVDDIEDFEYIGLAFARDTGGDAGASVTIDNLAVNESPTIPTLSEWGMIILFAGLLVLTYRRLSRAHALPDGADTGEGAPT